MRVQKLDQDGYICQGTCQAFVTEEQYKNGITACGAKVCTLKGKPFVKGYKCHTCTAVYTENTEHKHI